MTHAALAGQLPTEQKIILQSSDDLLNALQSPRYGRPTGLGSVLDTAVRNGKMMDLKAFASADTSIYQKSWIPSLGMILKWTLHQAGLGNETSYDSSGRLKQGELILVEGLEQIAKQLLIQQAAQGGAVTDRVMSRAAFSQLLSNTETGALSVRETEYLLRYLSRDKQLLTYDSSTVKFKAPSTDKPEPISSEDATIASLKGLIAVLESRVSSLSLRVTTLQKTAQSAVQSKNKNAALAALRSKKLAERNLQQSTDMLNQLEEVYAKIEQAVDQVQVLQVMQSSAQTLKSLNQRVGDVEKVDAIMDDLREQMDQTNEVGQILQEPLSATAALDETEIDDEFEALEKEEQASKEQLHEQSTRARLAELEGVQRAAQEKAVAEVDKDSTHAALDSELENSSQKLERMHLDDDDKQNEEPHPRITEPEMSTA